MRCARPLAAALLCALVAAFQGCIILPVPHERPIEVSTGVLGWTVPGISTRRDFILRLGDPLVSQRNDTIFVYAADTVAYIWLTGSTYAGAGGGISKTYFALVRFDTLGVLEELRLADGYMKDPCVATGFCDPLPHMHPGSR